MIHYLRHCESLFNIDHACGELDCGLSEAGIKHAKSLTSDVHYDLVLCSPMKRAIDTIGLSKITYDELRVEEKLREHMIEICDFKQGEIICKESVEELLVRVEYIKDMLKNISDKKILLVGHADFFFYFSSTIIDGEYFGTWLDNGQIYGPYENSGEIYCDVPV